MLDRRGNLTSELEGPVVIDQLMFSTSSQDCGFQGGNPQKRWPVLSEIMDYQLSGDLKESHRHA